MIEEQNGSVTQREEIVRTEFLGNDYLTCTFVKKDSQDQTPVTFNKNYNGTLDVSFNRATGEINTIFTKISISNGRKSYSIELIPETGYHRIVQ